MDTLTAARVQMELSLGFHMIFSALGIAMPLLMVAAEWLHLRTAEAHYDALARKWSKATGLLFAIGAVSGTGLSFELGLLWPEFVRLTGPVIGPGFALEGYAFFLEAIFVGLYLYGWDRLSPKAHFLVGIPVAITGLVSGILVTAVNAWMQQPSGLLIANGESTVTDVMAIFKSPVWGVMSFHSSIACYEAVGFAVAGVYAVAILRGQDDAHHRSGLRISMAMASIAALAQLLSGHESAKSTAIHQPVKLAAMEALLHTTKGAPSLVGGIPIDGKIRYGLEIPGGLSFLAFDDFNATVQGLDAFPPDTHPPVIVTHLAFQTMVGTGTALAGLAVLFWAWVFWKKSRPVWLLRFVALASPLGMIALEAGWVVTEVGRQPWIAFGLLRTRDAVTTRPDVTPTLIVFTALYTLLGVMLVVLLRRLARSDAGGSHVS